MQARSTTSAVREAQDKSSAQDLHPGQSFEASDVISITRLVGADDLAGLDHATLRAKLRLRVSHGGRGHRGRVGRHASAWDSRGHRGATAIATAGRLGAAAATVAATVVAAAASAMTEDVQQATATAVITMATVVATA
jgi:hypothetical protein